jgi:Tfp pilus assembly major pilin PilA
MFCPKCGSRNDETALYCTACGNALPLPDAQAAVALDEYYKAVIGPKNQDYYLSHFSRFDRDGIRISWNWPAFLMTFYWLLYRKMWLNSLAYFFFPYVLAFVFALFVVLTDSDPGSLIGSVYLGYLAAIFVLMPMYANALYYRHCKKRITEVRATAHDTQRQLGELAGKGGTSNVVLIVILIFAFVAIIGILAAIAIPAYQDYTTGARTVQAFDFGKTATASVTGFYQSHQAIPENIEETGFELSLPPSVKGLSFDRQSGMVSITVEGSTANGKSILFVPSLDTGNKLVWTCLSKEIQDRYLPVECRQRR